MKDQVTQLFSGGNERNFEHTALEVFRHQAENCPVYHEYLGHLNVQIAQVQSLDNIPYLPISFFKTHDVRTGQHAPEIVFSSSGTTGLVTSRHNVTDVDLYEASFNAAFENAYGPASELCILALLPSYLERSGSSLIYMIDALLKQSTHRLSGYFLYNHEDLYQALGSLKAEKQKTILFGVTYALLDFIEEYAPDFPDLIVMETGGMKGKRKEMIREELHHILCRGFGVKKIHSEYGMTELLSQAYSEGDGLFYCPPWMKVVLRDTNDPLSLLQNKQTGGINVIDLANLNSCSFIATQDLGRLHNNGSFEVLGRFDNSDIRGCNLLVG